MVSLWSDIISAMEKRNKNNHDCFWCPAVPVPLPGMKVRTLLEIAVRNVLTRDEVTKILSQVNLETTIAERYLDSLSLSERKMIDMLVCSQCRASKIFYEQPEMGLNEPEWQIVKQILEKNKQAGKVIVMLSNKKELLAIADEIKPINDGSLDCSQNVYNWQPVTYEQVKKEKWQTSETGNSGIQMENRADGTGLEIEIPATAQGISIQVPTCTGADFGNEKSVNRIHAASGCQVQIVAGCSSFSTCEASKKQTQQEFILEPGAKVEYVDWNWGNSWQQEAKVNNEICAEVGERASLRIVQAQMELADKSENKIKANLAAGAELAIEQRELATGKQKINNNIQVTMEEGARWSWWQRLVATQKAEISTRIGAPAGEVKIEGRVSESGKIKTEGREKYQEKISDLDERAVRYLQGLGMAKQEAQARLIDAWLQSEAEK